MSTPASDDESAYATAAESSASTTPFRTPRASPEPAPPLASIDAALFAAPMSRPAPRLSFSAPRIHARSASRSRSRSRKRLRRDSASSGADESDDADLLRASKKKRPFSSPGAAIEGPRILGQPPSSPSEARSARKAFASPEAQVKGAGDDFGAAGLKISKPRVRRQSLPFPHASDYKDAVERACNILSAQLLERQLFGHVRALKQLQTQGLLDPKSRDLLDALIKTGLDQEPDPAASGHAASFRLTKAQRDAWEGLMQGIAGMHESSERNLRSRASERSSSMSERASRPGTGAGLRASYVAQQEMAAPIVISSGSEDGDSDDAGSGDEPSAEQEHEQTPANDSEEEDQTTAHHEQKQNTISASSASNSADEPSDEQQEQSPLVDGDVELVNEEQQQDQQQSSSDNEAEQEDDDDDHQQSPAANNNQHQATAPTIKAKVLLPPISLASKSKFKPDEPTILETPSSTSSSPSSASPSSPSPKNANKTKHTPNGTSSTPKPSTPTPTSHKQDKPPQRPSTTIKASATLRAHKPPRSAPRDARRRWRRELRLALRAEGGADADADVRRLLAAKEARRVRKRVVRRTG